MTLNAASKGVWPLKDDLPCSSVRLALYNKTAEVIAAIADMIEKITVHVGGITHHHPLGIGHCETGGQSKTDQSLELLMGPGVIVAPPAFHG